MTGTNTPAILGIGNSLVDIMVLLKDEKVLEEFNLPKGSMTLVDREVSEAIQQRTDELEKKITTGGSVANAMNGVANLSVPCGFIGSITDDDMGNFFRRRLLETGIKPELKKVDSRTGRAVALVTPDGERTFGTYLGAAIELGAEDISPAIFKGYSYFFIEGYLVQNHALILEAARAAKEAGLLVAIDLASYNVVEANLDVLNVLVDDFADIVFANEEEAKAFTGKEPLDALENISSRCDIAVVKVGAEGAYIKQGSVKVHVPTIKTNVVDTTGAGDFFAAGFLAGQAKGYSIEKSGRLGALLGGNVVSVVGAQLTTEMWQKIREKENVL